MASKLPSRFAVPGSIPTRPVDAPVQGNQNPLDQIPIDTHENVIRILPQKYVHVLDTNKNLTRLEIGPQTLVQKEHERLVLGPEDMIVLRPQTYCTIANPVVKNQDGTPKLTSFGQVMVKFGDYEYRISEDYKEPFPLYPGEILDGGIEQLKVVPRYSAIRLKANREFQDGEEFYYAGREWQVQGPLVFRPKEEVDIVGIIEPQVVTQNNGLHLRAIKNLEDGEGNNRRAGQEWLVRRLGSYIPGHREQVVKLSKGIILTETNGIHLRALKTFKDVYGVERQAGSQWLITRQEAQVHIPDVYEEIVEEIIAVSLNSLQFVVIVNPFDTKTNTNNWGHKKMIRGETMLFKYPGEKFEKNAIQNVHILGENQALLLQAVNYFVDEDKKTRSSGERWMIQGPREYLPPVQVIILETRTAIPLDDNQGIYVKDINSGEVRAISGKTYLLQANEELWEKQLNSETEQLLKASRAGVPYIPPKVDDSGNLSYQVRYDEAYVRDKTRVVTYKASHNSAVQIYDYQNKAGRIIFGPSLIKLDPYEEFTIVRLSGGKPKRENVIQSLSLSLGPDFMSDEIVVETSDHARLNVRLSYNWQFKVDATNTSECEKLFNVKDFVGDACKSIASRVRGAVSAISFEDFHHHSSMKIKEAVFGRNKEDNSIRDHLIFDSNNLVITSVDIQGQEIIDIKTRGFLAESIHMAIQISTRMQEEMAQHQADLLDAENRGKLDKQQLQDDAKVEEERIKLLQTEQLNGEIVELGIATAQAKAEAQGLAIRGDSLLKTSQLRSKRNRVEFENELSTTQLQYQRHYELQKKQAEFSLSKAKQMAQIEKDKFTKIVTAIGKDTIIQIATAGPDMQARLLKGLGLKGFLISDGQNPINLFNTANGFISKSN